MTCVRAQEFLAKNKVEAQTIADAKKAPLAKKEALTFVRNADEIFASKGKKVVHFDLKKDKPSDDDLAAVVIGPSGNLRAPTLKIGRTLIIGFDEETYRKVLS
jgi:arsenate reductase-like glutaredoxin family protein